MVNFLLGQPSGYPKFPCFICLWDSRDRANHYTRKQWSPRTEMTPNKQLNIVNEPLVDGEKIIIPPLHIKLGLVKQLLSISIRKVTVSNTYAELSKI